MGRSGTSVAISSSGVNPNAAGIDLGSREHYVALPPGRASEVVRKFGCYTEDLEAMAHWLVENGVKTVAMESTGVFWVPVFQVLDGHGLDVQLVCTKHLKSVPGRKTDIFDCQWLQQLHAAGLLRGSFRPENEICVLRTYVRQRATLVQEATRRTLRIQKSLEQMNIQLHKVVSTITGKTGQAILNAILAGERDPKELAKHRDARCKRSVEEIQKALRGDWREEHLFCLAQEAAAYAFIQQQIAACDEAAAKELAKFEAKAPLEELGPAKSKKADTELRKSLFLMTGVDVTQIPGLAASLVQSLLAETGPDMTKWTSASAFANWCTVAPSNKITGGKRYKSSTTAASRVAGLFGIAAQTLANSKTTFLGAVYRRQRGRKGSPFANRVTAHKLAKLYYLALRHRRPYVEPGADFHLNRSKVRLTNRAVQQLRHLGYDVQLSELPRLQAVVS